MEPTISDSENRQYSRIPKQIRVEICTLKFPLPTQSEGICASKNISVTGLCITGKKPFGKGTVVSLSLKITGWQSYKKPFSRFMDISDEPPLTAIGEVVWCRKITGRSEYDIGVRFVNIYEDDHQALMKYLQNAESESIPTDIGR